MLRVGEDFEDKESCFAFPCLCVASKTFGWSTRTRRRDETMALVGCRCRAQTIVSSCWLRLPVPPPGHQPPRAPGVHRAADSRDVRAARLLGNRVDAAQCSKVGTRAGAKESETFTQEMATLTDKAKTNRNSGNCKQRKKQVGHEHGLKQGLSASAFKGKPK